VENVTNLLAVNDGSAFGEVIGDLAASMYDAEWDIPAAAVGMTGCSREPWPRTLSRMASRNSTRQWFAYRRRGG
jgi:hypothetical protein